MARPKKVKYKINLRDIFGEKFPDDDSLKDLIGEAVLERITERTQEGISKDGKRFPGYSKDYMKATGKSNPPDLTLTGDMLETMDILEKTSQTITFGFPDETENAKAYNHTQGVTVPRRDFFGLPKKELKSIASQFKDDVRSIKEDRRSEDLDRQDKEKEQANELINLILSGSLDQELF